MTAPFFPIPQQDASLRQRTRQTLDRLRRELLDERTSDGHWVGQLSASSLSTATAVSALSALLIHGHAAADEQPLRDGVARGIDYLKRSQNRDGGFGDTDRSHSNIATSYLVLAAAELARRAGFGGLPERQTARLNEYIDATGRTAALRARYGKDKTFVVPILTNLAIAGLAEWDQVAALPFEAAVFPQSMYRLLQMPVVSYAIPALVAIGQAKHFHGPRAIWPLRWIRAASVSRTMKVLRRMQPDSGGYLEATPLTSFVVMSLAATGRGNHPVCQAGLRFLIDSMDSDGSWPIDTNLATWVTSLAVHALACDPADDGAWCSDSLVHWQLACQHTARHPFTGAEPGGWGWSDRSGAVPDSDDTPAAVLALAGMQRWVDGSLRERCRGAAAKGIAWLRKLQNRDGGWPTFCRGWGKLPFDRSSNDLTAHALRAWVSQASAVPMSASDSARLAKAISFLHANQQEDGSWLPLWFGNQDRDDEANPVYGTSRVLLAAPGLLSDRALRRGCEYLIATQNPDGGWGGGPSVTAWLTAADSPRDWLQRVDSQLPPVAWETTSSIEETALAVDALATVLWAQRTPRTPGAADLPEVNGRNLSLPVGVESGPRGTPSPEVCSISPPWGFGDGNEAGGVAIIRGIEFLLGCVDADRHRLSWPIGFYFAKLWYHEKLYPLIFTITALGKYLRATAEGCELHRPG
jgi:squalene-hopene/tetraprenyl-beta-curcumene cyclase